MPTGLESLRRGLRGSCLLAAIMVLAAASASGAEKTLHSFQGGNDGIAPWGVLITDGAGNLYGTTNGGGGGTGCQNSVGCGTVFKLAPDGSETLLHAFAGGCDGGNPFSGLVEDETGAFYGTTALGGVCNSDVGYGTVYKVTSDGTESVVYAFKGGSDGEGPAGSLTTDGNGNWFGVADGGDGTGCNGTGCGVVFEVTPTGNETVLYTFLGGSDGAYPIGGVLRDAAGNLFGTTTYGGRTGTGCSSLGCGTVFKLSPDGTETILYAFQGGSDGSLPLSGVIADDSGNLYGTTEGGGSEDVGTVFKVTPVGDESALYSFKRESGGYLPYTAGVVFDKAGNLYGTTSVGGVSCRAGGCGTVFKLTPEGKENVLYSFKKPHGAHPSSGLLLGSDGILYGTTLNGGKHQDGVVFKLKK